MVWGTFRLEERDAKGERIRKSVALGLRKEFATKTAIDDKLKEVMQEFLNPKPESGAAKEPDEQMLYSELVADGRRRSSPCWARAPSTITPILCELMCQRVSWHAS